MAIYDGPSDQSELIGKYCGFDKPPIFTSSGRFVTVQFASDETVNEMGFQLEYSVGKWVCCKLVKVVRLYDVQVVQAVFQVQVE